MERNLGVIAREIDKDWKKVNFAARPYLNAMYYLNKITDSYGLDSGRYIVLTFLNNASTWEGETARKIKAELKQMLKQFIIS